MNWPGLRPLLRSIGQDDAVLKQAVMGDRAPERTLLSDPRRVGMNFEIGDAQGLEMGQVSR